MKLQNFERKLANTCIQIVCIAQQVFESCFSVLDIHHVWHIHSVQAFACCGMIGNGTNFWRVRV